MASILSYLPYLAQGGVAIIVVILIILRMLVPGWLYTEKTEEIKELQRALEIERQRSDAAVQAAQATRDILLSLRGRIYEEGQDDTRLRGPSYRTEVARRVANTPEDEG
jgi:hypothetical protein